MFGMYCPDVILFIFSQSDHQCFAMAEGVQQKANKSKASCCVPLCCKTGYSLEDGEKVSFHRFPLQEPTKKEWLAKIRRDEGPKFRVGKSTRICSRHFLKTDFLVTKGEKKTLKQNACPTVFPWRPHKKPRTPCRRKLIVPNGNEKSKDTLVADEEYPACTGTSKPPQTDVLLTKISQLEKQLQLQKEAAAFFQKERDLLREGRKQRNPIIISALTASRIMTKISVFTLDSLHLTPSCNVITC